MKYKHYVYHISYIDHTDNQSLKILKTKMSRTNTSYSKVNSNIKDSEKKMKTKRGHGASENHLSYLGITEEKCWLHLVL